MKNVELAMGIGHIGQHIVDFSLWVNDRYPRNWVTGLLLHIALPFLNLRNWMLGIKTNKEK